MTIFKDRLAAGKALAPRLNNYVGRDDVLVLALPRGGVPVGYAIAKQLKLPLDVWVVRKLGVPGQPELAMGAIADGGVTVFNAETRLWPAVDQKTINAIIAREKQELERRARTYRGGRLPLDVVGKTIVLVDDGAATGATMRAAVQALRRVVVGKIVVALPTAARAAHHELQQIADEVICLSMPEPFFAVGRWYREFEQTSDGQVIALLRDAANNAVV